MPGECVERAHLRPGPRHVRDPARDNAQFLDVGHRVVAEVNLRDLHFAIVVARQRLQDASACRNASETGQRGGIVHLVGLQRRRFQAITILVQRVTFVQRADQLDGGRFDGVARHQIADHPHELGALFEQWLAEHYPERAGRVLGLRREMRGGRLNDPRFGHRMRGEGAYAALLSSRFAAACRRDGLDPARGPELDCSLFRGDPAAPRQADLFS
jgi:hypothetical protein